MSSSPSLKITLKLSGPKPPVSAEASSFSPKKRAEVGEDSAASTPLTTDSPRKRARTNGTGGGRSRRPKITAVAAEGTPVPDTPLTVDDDNNSTTEEVSNTTINRRGGGGGGGAGGGNQANNAASGTISRKDLLKYKDVQVRKWQSKPLVFYTLDGSEVSIPSWQSDEKMTINQHTTEPITVAEIDQLFSSTAGEKDFRPFLCTQPGCSKAFTTFDQLQTHETNMHGTKKLVCGIDGCHKSFVTTGQLTKHRKMVHFRAARKAKLAAAAAAEAEAAAASAENNEETPAKMDDEATPSGDLVNDNDSVDIANL